MHHHTSRRQVLAGMSGVVAAMAIPGLPALASIRAKTDLHVSGIPGDWTFPSDDLTAAFDRVLNAEGDGSLRRVLMDGLEAVAWTLDEDDS